MSACRCKNVMILNVRMLPCHFVHFRYGFFGKVVEDEVAFQTKVDEMCRELGPPSLAYATPSKPPQLPPTPVKTTTTAVRVAATPSRAASSIPTTAAAAHRTLELPPPSAATAIPEVDEQQRLLPTPGCAPVPSAATAVALSEGFYLQLERERAAAAQLEREQVRQLQLQLRREERAERETCYMYLTLYASTLTACVAVVACVVRLAKGSSQ